MIEHHGDECPTDPDQIVSIDLGDGRTYTGEAGAFNWGPGLGPDGEGRIRGYVPLVPDDAPRPRAGAARRRARALSAWLPRDRHEAHPLIV